MWYTACVSNSEVRWRIWQPSSTTLVKQRQLKLFGHVARADQAEDHKLCTASIFQPT